MSDTLEQPETIDIPVEALRLNMPDNLLRLAEAETDDEGKVTKKPRFSMQVHSGDPMPHWWHGTLAVNLSGIRWEGKHVAALLDHDASKRVGYTTKLYLDDDKGLMAEGIMLTNDDAQRVRNDSTEGFPWQASCGLVAEKVLRLEDGAEHEVNGHKIVGPALVFEQALLREVTFCALGADSNTSSDASLNDQGERVRVPLSVKVSTMTTKKEPTPATPEAAPVVDAEAVALQAQQAESDRAGFILELAADSQMKLARQLIKDGTSKEAAALALAKDARERDAEAAPTAKPTPATAPLSSTAPEPEQDATLAMPEGEDKWRKQWSEDEKLRAEFDGVEGAWLSWNKNRHRCSEYGSKDAFTSAQES